METTASPPPHAFALTGDDGVVTLDSRGIHHPTGARGIQMEWTAYEDITHLSSSPRSLWIGARDSVYSIPRSMFVDENAPEHLVRVLLERIDALPDGAAQLARMAQIEQRSQLPDRLYATWGLAGACILVFIAQLVFGESLHLVGYFTGPLVSYGEWWRVVTGNLLHGFGGAPLVGLVHLTLNVLGVIGIGALVERALGTTRTICVMATSAVGAMAASGAVSPMPVVGVSGVVFGLLGALMWIELRFGEELPAWWRVPRRGLWWMLGLSVGISFLPFIAGAAHAGGFLGGEFAAALLAWRSIAPRPAPAWLRSIAATSVVASLVAVGFAGYMLLRPEGYSNQVHAQRLSEASGVGPEVLNHVAWLIAIDPEAPREVLEVGLILAVRAVETSGREPHILDTLAEVLFRLGETEAAIVAIDEAIEQMPDRDYYREQRRRFLGERDAADRPVYDPPPEGRLSAPTTQSF